MSANTEIVKSVYDAFAKGDVASVLATFDDKIEWLEPATLPYNDQIGPQAVAEGTFGPLLTDFPDFSVTPEEIFDAGDVVVALGRYRGTGSATGKALDAEYAHVFRFRDGKITWFRTFTDTKAYLIALGQD